jgi:hypothetical protein
MKNKLSAIKLSLIFLALIVASCKKEADSSMIGSWDVATEISTKYQNNVQLSVDSVSYKPGEFILVIDADGTGKFIESGQWDDPNKVTFTWGKISDNNCSIALKVDPITTVPAEVEIVVNKNTLSWTSTIINGTFKNQTYLVGNRM